MFIASRQSPSPSLFRKLDESRVPSLLRHYPVSSVLRTPPTSRPPVSDFGYPYTEPSRPSPATNEISRVTRCSFPRMPSRRPRRVHLLSIGYLYRWRRPSPLDHRVGTLVLKSRGSMGSLVVRPASLQSFLIRSFLDPLSLVGRPTNRIFATGVYR